MQVGGNTIICSHAQSYGPGQGMILKDGWIDLLVEFRKLLIKQSTRISSSIGTFECFFISFASILAESSKSLNSLRNAFKESSRSSFSTFCLDALSDFLEPLTAGLVE